MTCLDGQVMPAARHRIALSSHDARRLGHLRRDPAVAAAPAEAGRHDVPAPAAAEPARRVR